MNLALRVCAFLATLVAVLGLSGRLTAKPPDLPVNDPPVLTPEEGSGEQTSPPPAGGAIRFSAPEPPRERAGQLLLLPELWENLGHIQEQSFQSIERPVYPLPNYLLVLKEPWRGSCEAEGEDTPAPASKPARQAGAPKKSPCAPPKPADKDGFTCPYLKQQAADRHAAMIADPQVSEDVLGNLDKLEAAQSLIEAADKLQHAGRRAEALHCLSLVQELCPGSRCALEAADKAARIATGQKSQSGSNEAADEGEARPQTKGSSSSKPCCCAKKQPTVSIKRVEYRGARHLKDGELAEITHLAVGQPLNPRRNRAACQEIIKALNEEGRPLADCKLLKGGKPSDDEVIFQISEGPKVAIRSISFRGNTFVSSGRLNTVVKSSVRDPGLPCGGVYNPQQVANDVGDLVKYYHKFGFFDAQVAPHIEWTPDGSGIHLTFQVEEGKRYRVQKPVVVFSDVHVCPCEQLEAYSTVKPGSFYSADAIELDKKKIEAFYGSRGQKVTVTDHRIYDKEKPGIVKVQYEINERPMDRVGEIHVIGNTRTRYNCKIRQAPFHVDQPEKSAQTPEPGVEEMVRGLLKACRLAAADHRQEQAVELARQAQALDPRSVLADPLVYRLAQLAGKPQKKEPVASEESSCPTCPACTAVQVVKPLMPCCPCIDGGIVQAFEQLMEEAERATEQSGAEQAETPDPAKQPASSSTCPAEQHQAGSEEKSEMQGGMLSCVQQWLNGQEHGTLMFGLGMDEQLRCFVKCNLTLGDRVYHIVVGRGCPVLWTTPNAAVAAKKPSL